MAYGLVSPGLTPAGFGAGQVGGLGGFLGRWGDQWRGSMNSGMDFGTKFYNYGAANRIGPNAERNAQQKLNTGLVTDQNTMLRQLGDQRVATCWSVGWATPECQELRAAIDGMQPAPPTASRILGTSPQFDWTGSNDAADRSGASTSGVSDYYAGIIGRPIE